MGSRWRTTKADFRRAAKRAPQLAPIGRRSDAGFDRWLGGQLRKLYDDVLSEEVPEHLVEVVRAFDEEPESKGDDNLRGHGGNEPARQRSRRATAD